MQGLLLSKYHHIHYDDLLDQKNQELEHDQYLLIKAEFQQIFEYEIRIGFLVYGLAITTKVLWEICQIFYKLRTYSFWWNMH